MVTPEEGHSQKKNNSASVSHFKTKLKNTEGFDFNSESLFYYLGGSVSVIRVMTLLNGVPPVELLLPAK